MRTILRNGLDRYEVLKADEPLRRGERLVRFASERGALEFLIGVGGPARRDLHRLADDDFAGEFSGVRGDEVPAEIARRVARGELKIAHVEAAPPRVRSGGGEFVVLEARDRLRRGESWVRVMDEATAIRFARLVSTLSREEQRRLIPVASAVGGGSQREQTRSLSRLLRGGQIRIARLQTLTRAGGSAPPEPEMTAFGIADAISLGVGFIPIVGDAVDIAGAIVGKDLITGEVLTPEMQIATAVGTLVGSGKAARMGLKGAKHAMGFVQGAGKSAFTPNRLQHASRHLTDAGLLPNWSKKTGEMFTEIGSNILENPLKTFDHKVGMDAVKGFHGKVDAKDVVIFVYKEGKYQGQVATSVVPTAQQMLKWGLK